MAVKAGEEEAKDQADAEAITEEVDTAESEETVQVRMKEPCNQNHGETCRGPGSSTGLLRSQPQREVQLKRQIQEMTVLK